MLSNEVFSNSTVSLKELFPNFTHQFLEPFKDALDPDLHKGMLLDFELRDRKQKHKISPILRLAKPEDAEEITEIYKELYDGTYPYKEMEDVGEVRKMILDPSIQWIIYQDPSYNIAGCITFVLDFIQMRGYIRGFMLKRKYQGRIDITKAMIGSRIAMLYKFKDKIYTWYVENRTAHAKSQYAMWVCGIAPIGFYPNKDKFLGKVESDLMQICYDIKILKELRTKKIPQIISPVESCYKFSNAKYNLGNCQIQNPGIILNMKQISQAKKNLLKNIEIDKFGYQIMRFSLSSSDSFLEFLYSPQVNNFEKIEYKVSKIEELYVFVQELIKLRKELNIRYCEVFVSAYKPSHQMIFYKAGLIPRGYVPSWNYNQVEGLFEDNILLNWFKGLMSEDIQLIDEGKKLLDKLPLVDTYNSENHGRGKKGFMKKFPITNSLKKRLSYFLNFPKILKVTLMMGLFFYILLLFGSVITASLSEPIGYNFIKHTISKLGSSKITASPFIFDIACIIGGFTTVLLYYCFLRKIERFSIEKEKRVDLASKLSNWGCIFGVIGSFGIIFVGIFSLDRAGPYNILHNWSAVVAFSGFIMSFLLFGVLIFRCSIKIPKFIGLNCLIPLFILIVFSIVPFPLLEWILLFSILSSLFPFFYWATFRYFLY